MYLRHPVSDQTKEQLYQKADEVYENIVEILMHNKIQPIQSEPLPSVEEQNDDEEPEAECGT